MAQRSILGNISFTPYAAGSKVYSQVMGSPNMGPVDKTGYRDRDRRIQARKNAILNKMKAGAVGAYANADALRMSR